LTEAHAATERSSTSSRDAKGSPDALVKSLLMGLDLYFTDYFEVDPGVLDGNHQGVLLRPDWGEGPSGQGALRRGVPRMRRLHPAAQRQRRRVRVLQGLPPRR
jgi:hypothetical protein